MYQYYVFIDDTGTKDLKDKNSNFFSYSCIICKKESIFKIESSILLEKMFLMSEKVELKSRWFRREELRKKYYLEPFKISDEIFSNFTKKLFDLICTLPLHCLGSVLDKKKHEGKYKYPYNPSAVCYELLLQHIANYLTQYNGQVERIIIDDMTGKTEKGNEWKKLLVDQHKELKKGTSPFYKNWSQRNSMDYSRIPDSIDFCDSLDSTLLQIADLCAYNVMRQGQDFWGNFDDEPFYNGYKWIKPIMHCNPNTKQIISYGAVCFP